MFFGDLPNQAISFVWSSRTRVLSNCRQNESRICSKVVDIIIKNIFKAGEKVEKQIKIRRLARYSNWDRFEEDEPHAETLLCLV